MLLRRRGWPALVETLVAVLSGGLVGTMVAAAGWMLRPWETAEVLALSIDLVATLKAIVAVTVLGLGLHAVFRWSATPAARPSPMPVACQGERPWLAAGRYRRPCAHRGPRDTVLLKNL
jgi:hypothetical protein